MIPYYTLICYCFISILLINCGYYCYFSTYCFSKKESFSDPKKIKKGVSVIVCAKNEAENLPFLIEKILAQHYPIFEILLVNDHSSDGSLEIMRQFSAENQNVTALYLEQDTGKKPGLTLGISKANYEQLLFIDGDCLPDSKFWISSMTEKLQGDSQIVLGYSAYQKIAGSWLNKLIRFETLFTALQYFAYAKNQNAYMGVGRNLSYIKSIFDTAKGFENHAHLKAGDDDLFVNQNATKSNVAICDLNKAFTRSKPKLSWESWITQKRRHVGIAKHYRLRHQVQLGLFYTSQVLFFILAGTLIFIGIDLLFILFLIALRELLVLLMFSKAASKLNEKDLIPFLLLLEPFLISMQMLIFILNSLVKPHRWS